MAGGSAASSRRPPLSLAEVEPGSENERLGLARDSMFRNPRILKVSAGCPRSLPSHPSAGSGERDPGKGVGVSRSPRAAPGHRSHTAKFPVKAPGGWQQFKSFSPHTNLYDEEGERCVFSLLLSVLSPLNTR